MAHDRRIHARPGASPMSMPAGTARRALWGRLLGWVAVAILLGVLFQLFALQLQDRTISFVLTMLSLVSGIGVVRRDSGPRSAPAAYRRR